MSMNGPKEMKGDETEFDSWSRSQTAAAAHQSHQNQPYASTGGNMGDVYGMGANYYAQTMFPYTTATGQQDHHSTAWSNGAGPDMTFLTGYGGAGDQGPSHHSTAHYMDAMFGSQSSFGYNSFNAFFPSGSAAGASTGDHFWGSGSGKQTTRGGNAPGGPYRGVHEDQPYYGRDSYGDQSVPGVSLKHVESGMNNLTLDHIKSNEQFSAKTVGGGPFGSSFESSKKLDSLGSGSTGSAVGQGPKKMTWASIASQPAKSQTKSSSSLKSKMAAPAVLSSSKHLQSSTATSMDAIGTWESKNGSSSAVKGSVTTSVQPQSQHQMSARAPSGSSGPATGSAWSSAGSRNMSRGSGGQMQGHGHPHGGPGASGVYLPPNSSIGTTSQHGAGINSVPNHHQHQHQQQQQQHHHQQQHQPPQQAQQHTGHGQGQGQGQGQAQSLVAEVNAAGYPLHPVLDKLRVENTYNPKEFDLNPKNARFFIIKSYSEDDIHRSIKYSIWCSTEHGNKRLDGAFKSQETRGPVFLFYSVNGSGHFCGMAQMVSPLDYNASSNVWAQDKWKGQFRVKWIYVKDVPNAQLRHIRLENNENKPVTNSRDTQEVPIEKGKAVLKILHHYRHSTSIFDDFLHYEKRQEEEGQRRVGDTPPPPPSVPKARPAPNASWKD